MSHFKLQLCLKIRVLVVGIIDFLKICKFLILCMIVTIKTITDEISVKIRSNFMYHTPKSVILWIFMFHFWNSQKCCRQVAVCSFSADKTARKSYRIDYYSAPETPIRSAKLK